MKRVKPNDYKEIFSAAERGELADIWVLDVTLNDWEAFLQYLSKQHHIHYEESGIPKPLPKVDVIFERYAETPVTLKVCFPGFTVNCFFFDVDQIEMDILSTDINSVARADLVFNLMSDVARLLGKPVIMTPEGSNVASERIWDRTLCFADPKTGEITKTV